MHGEKVKIVIPYSLVYIYQGLEETSSFPFKVKIILQLSMSQACRNVGDQRYRDMRRLTIGDVLRNESLADFVVVRTYI
jgi:hypothetical protein